MVQFLHAQSTKFDLNVNNQTAWALCETFHRDLRAETHSGGISICLNQGSFVLDNFNT